MLPAEVRHGLSELLIAGQRLDGQRAAVSCLLALRPPVRSPRLLGAIIIHRKAADSAKEMTPAWLALLPTLAYLTIALIG